MGRKSKGKANRNNQQAVKVSQPIGNQLSGDAAKKETPVAEETAEIAPSIAKSEPSSSNDAPTTAVAEAATAEPVNVAQEIAKEEPQEQEMEDTGAEFSQVGKKKRNRNRNKKKNQQNIQEVEQNATAPDENAPKSPPVVPEVAKDVQNKEEMAEKALNASSKRSEKNNKKKNAEKANQVASVDENRICGVAIDTVVKANESGDNVVANDVQHTKVPKENLSHLAGEALKKLENPPEKKKEELKPDAKPTVDQEISSQSKSGEKPAVKDEVQCEIKPEAKSEISPEIKEKPKEKSQDKNEPKPSIKQEAKGDIKTDLKSDEKREECKAHAPPSEVKQNKFNKKAEKQKENKNSKAETKPNVKAQPEAKHQDDPVKVQPKETATSDNKTVQENIEAAVEPDKNEILNKPEIIKETKAEEKSEDNFEVKTPAKEQPKSESKKIKQIEDVKSGEQVAIKTEAKPEDKLEVKSEDKTDSKPEVKVVPKSDQKQEGKSKNDKSQKKQQKQQKTEQKVPDKKTKPEDVKKNTEPKITPDKTTELTTDQVPLCEAPKAATLPKTDETKELAKLVDTASKVEVPLIDPITIEISQPLIITTEVCKDKLKEPSTESTLAQLIELVSNTDIPLQDMCPAGVKEKMAEFQKPIAETGAALAELVNVVAGVDVPLKDVELPIIEDKTDKGLKGKKGKQTKGNETKSPQIQEKNQDIKKADATKPEAKPSELKKDNKKNNEATDSKDSKQDSSAKEKIEVKESTAASQELQTVVPQTEETKETAAPDKEIEVTQVQEIKKDTEASLNESHPEVSSEAPKKPESQDSCQEKTAISTEGKKDEKIEPKSEQTQTCKDKETKPLEEPKKESSVQTAPSSQKPCQNTSPPITKKNKDDANIRAAKEKSEAKAKEVPEKNPQEKMDAISFEPDKLIDILDTKMQTLPTSTGAIKKVPKQKAEQEKDSIGSSDMGAQTQISVLPSFHDKTKPSEEVKASNEGRKINQPAQQVQQQKTDKSGKTSPQKSPPKSPAGKKPQIPPKPEHLLKKTPQQGPQKEPLNQSSKAPEKPAGKKQMILSDDEEEFIEYKFTPRQVFLATICQVCKIALQSPNPCLSCLMVSYCSEAHAKEDAVIHQPLCRALQEIARKRGGHVYNNAKILSSDDFRNLRVHTLNLCESLTQRPLQPFEKEILIFPRICCTPTCREWRPPLLTECQKCGQVSYCREQPAHLSEDHQRWCPFFLLYQKLIIRQKTIGRIEPTLPSRIFLQRYELPATMEDVFKELYKNNPAIKDDCSYATLTQLATAPLTAYSAMQKVKLSVAETLTIHLVGAELQFEGDTLDKWEAFFLHLIPQVLELRVVFIGPELNAENLPLDILSRIRMCRTCRQSCRGVKFDFQCGKLYHDYAKLPAFTKPDLICFFNPGLYRATGFSGLDTWPETIKVTTSLNCPIVVTSYTELEAPQDLTQLHRASSRPLNLIHPPMVNPFSSQRPERNFISDEISPMIFKNYFVFIVS